LDEQGQGLDRDPDVSLDACDPSVDLVKSLGDRGLALLVGVRRQEGSEVDLYARRADLRQPVVCRDKTPARGHMAEPTGAAIRSRNATR